MKNEIRSCRWQMFIKEMSLISMIFGRFGKMFWFPASGFLQRRDSVQAVGLGQVWVPWRLWYRSRGPVGDWRWFHGGFDESFCMVLWCFMMIFMVIHKSWWLCFVVPDECGRCVCDSDGKPHWAGLSTRCFCRKSVLQTSQKPIGRLFARSGHFCSPAMNTRTT